MEIIQNLILHLRNLLLHLLVARMMGAWWRGRARGVSNIGLIGITCYSMDGVIIRVEIMEIRNYK